jgi:hypothetical protein
VSASPWNKRRTIPRDWLRMDGLPIRARGMRVEDPFGPIRALWFGLRRVRLRSGNNAARPMSVPARSEMSALGPGRLTIFRRCWAHLAGNGSADETRLRSARDRLCAAGSLGWSGCRVESADGRPRRRTRVKWRPAPTRRPPRASSDGARRRDERPCRPHPRCPPPPIFSHPVPWLVYFPRKNS